MFVIDPNLIFERVFEKSLNLTGSGDTCARYWKPFSLLLHAGIEEKMKERKQQQANAKKNSAAGRNAFKLKLEANSQP